MIRQQSDTSSTATVTDVRVAGRETPKRLAFTGDTH